MLKKIGSFVLMFIALFLMSSIDSWSGWIVDLICLIPGAPVILFVAFCFGAYKLLALLLRELFAAIERESK